MQRVHKRAPSAAATAPEAAAVNPPKKPRESQKVIETHPAPPGSKFLLLTKSLRSTPPPHAPSWETWLLHDWGTFSPSIIHCSWLNRTAAVIDYLGDEKGRVVF